MSNREHVRTQRVNGNVELGDDDLSLAGVLPGGRRREPVTIDQAMPGVEDEEAEADEDEADGLGARPGG